MSDDRIVNISEYIRARKEELEGSERAPALSGIEGERRHLVLPLWRVAYVAHAGWVGLLRRDAAGAVEAVAVVDMRHDPARPHPDQGLPTVPFDDDPPCLRALPGGGLLLALGEGPRDSRWSIVLAERGDDAAPLEREAREDLVYLAGECAALVALLEA